MFEHIQNKPLQPLKIRHLFYVQEDYFKFLIFFCFLIVLIYLSKFIKAIKRELLLCKE